MIIQVSRKTQPAIETRTMRLDKWLWCARFFKTRALAADAVKTGKVLVDGIRPKPAKTISPGMRLKIHRGPYEYCLTIEALAAQRQSAADAASLYHETADSIAVRETLARQLKTEAALQPRPKGRPTKRERRELVRFNRRIRED